MRTIYVLKEIKWGIQFLRRISLRIGIIIILLAGFLSKGLTQELPNEMWHPGVIVLNDGDSIRGNIQYDFKTNLVQLATEGQVKAFSSQQLLSVSFHGQYFKRFRYFYALPFSINGSVDVPVFFEILEEGPITLMSREYVVVQNNNNYNSPFYRGTPRTLNSRSILSYDYFFLTGDGRIVQYSEKKKDLLSFFGRYQNEVEKYMRKNKLRYDRQLDLIKITNYYNELAAN